MKFDDGKDGRSKEGIPSTALREISLLKELNHPNVVALLQIYNPEVSNLQLIFEYCDYDLKKYIVNHVKKSQGNQKFYMEHETLRDFTRQMLVGLQECHKRRILHRDLKPQNVLVDLQNNTVKLADFGLARAQAFPPRPYTHEVVTLWQRAPEILLGSQDYDGGVDIWSIGCIMAEMQQRDPLFMGDSEIDQIHKIFQCLGTPTDKNWPGLSKLPDQRTNFPKWTGNKLRSKVASMDWYAFDLLSKMLEINPNERITAKDALEHPYFTK